MNPLPLIDLSAIRARKARLAHVITENGYRLLMAATAVFALVCIAMLYKHIAHAYLFGSIALCFYAIAVWYKRELSVLPVSGGTLTDKLSGDILGVLDPKQALTPRSVWHVLMKHWEINFLLNHLLMPGREIESILSNEPQDMEVIWHEATGLALNDESTFIEPYHIAIALILQSPVLQPQLSQMKLSRQDIIEVSLWIKRILDHSKREKPFFGGIGRDWSYGFTPLLSRFGQNISLAVEHGGDHFDWLAESAGVRAITQTMSQGANAIAIIGEEGVGKTSHMYALAQALLQGKTADKRLVSNQVIGLNASLILSNARGPGDLEHIILRLLQESIQAGHIILFLDNAQLFFSEGVGAFDITQILLPIVQGGRLRIVLAMSPHDFQNLKVRNSAFASLLSPVVLEEPPEHEVMRVLEDIAMGMEYQHGIIVPYDALREAYRLSGRYDQETAYPGKAIKLLSLALPHVDRHVLSEYSIQQAIEQSRGVKVGAAAPLEADALLHLEDKIHERMINQTHAVGVVAGALRRARAGVSDPRRPIGSFLFLGPTGVGKTELAKAIAATYFGAESNMVRLDMSEYQQPDDVRRLLSDGHDESNSLILAVRQQPFTVVLLDEIEKAHPNILNLLLQLLDEGTLTDTNGRPVSFKDCIIIATSNAGAQQIRERIAQGQKLSAFEDELIDQFIASGQFKPELLNRFDEIVLFRPLEPNELAQIVVLMLGDINKTLANQHIVVSLTNAAIAEIVRAGYDARLGARPMRRVLQRAVEDGVAGKILRGEAKAGDHIVMDVPDLNMNQEEF